MIPGDTSGVAADSNTVARIRDLESQVDLLEQDTATKSLVIADKDARLNLVDVEKSDLKRKMNDARKDAETVQKELDRKKNELADLQKTNNDLSSGNVLLSTRIIELQSRIKKLESDSSFNSRRIADLAKQVEAAKKNELANRNAASTFPGNLRIQVYDKSGEFKTPISTDTFLVYIIPYAGNNADILDDSKNILFAKDCDGFQGLLPKLSNWQRAYLKNGYYYFHDVIQNGKYKIKICNVIDGYFNLKMPSTSGEVYWKQNGKDKIAIKLGKF